MTERVSVDKPSAGEGGEPAPEHPVCENCGKRHDPLSASQDRGWWFRTAMNNFGLAIVPALPLGWGVLNFITPTADVKLDGGQRQTVNSAFELTDERATTVRRVVVELDHPSIWDRLVAAGPSLVLAVLLAFLAYALWRIEVNTTAGPHQRPFTEKDERYLKRSGRSLWALWYVLMLVELLGGLALHLGGEAFVGPVSAGSLIVLGLATLVTVFARVYRKGSKAYADLEKIV
jgi:hypothetical protein